MFKLRSRYIFVIGIFLISLPLKGFDLQNFLMTPEFIENLKNAQKLENFNKMKSQLCAQIQDILKEETIGLTIDSLAIKSAQRDLYSYIKPNKKDSSVKLNEKESMTIFFLIYACGMPTTDIDLCDGEIWMPEQIGKQDIYLIKCWNQKNKKYMNPVFIDYYIQLLSYSLALQYVYTMAYPLDDPRATGYGTICGWKEGLWHINFWKYWQGAYGEETLEFSLKINGLFKSLISIFYWYKLNDIHTLPPDYILTCGIEMNNEPTQNCNNCPEPSMILY